LQSKLKLNLHPEKILIKKYRQGIDFLGYIVLPQHRVLRTKTKRRVINKIKHRRQDLKDSIISEESFNQSLQSYLGILKHRKGYNIQKKIEDLLK